MGAGKLSNGFIRTGTRILLDTFTQQYRKQCSKYCSLGLKIVFLIPVLRECPTVVGVNRNTGSWDSGRCNPILTTSHQRPQSKLPLKDSFQLLLQVRINIYIITFHCQTVFVCVSC